MLFIVFMTGCKKEEEVSGIRPTVTSTDPINKATNIATNTKVSANFSAEMDASTMTNSKFTVQQGSTTVPGEVEYSGTKATFKPTANLSPSTTYTATISTGAKSTAGVSLAKDYTWTFTTGLVPDVTRPTVTLADPADNSLGVTLSHSVNATFSEAMDHSSITSSTFTVKQGTTPVAGVVTYTGTKATFTPTNPLTANKVYTATVTTGAKDVAGNTLATNYTYTFTTAAAADLSLPSVLSNSPLANATNVARDKTVSVVFSEAMDPLTITASTFMLNQGTTPVSGTVAYSGTTATITPSPILAASTTYTATITTGAKDLAGNAIGSPVSWSFTTGTVAAGLAPVNLGSAINYIILAKTAISNIPTSALTGDLGLSPAATSFITGLALTNATGFATSVQVTGKIYAADMAPPTGINLTTAVSDMLLAYTDAAGRPTPDYLNFGTGNIGGKILTEGLYKWTTTVTAPSNVTISGGPNDVWIFQITGDLSVSNGVRINLNGGAQAKNIFWQVAGQATMGTTSHFEGIILSQTGITFQTGASMNGRALAQTAVILDKNAITKPQ